MPAVPNLKRVVLYLTLTVQKLTMNLYFRNLCLRTSIWQNLVATGSTVFNDEFYRIGGIHCVYRRRHVLLLSIYRFNKSFIFLIKYKTKFRRMNHISLLYNSMFTALLV